MQKILFDDLSDYPGESIVDITGLHGLHQITNKPTHFYQGEKPSCIDLIFCSQPNLISESGILPSLLPQCYRVKNKDDVGHFAKIDFRRNSLKIRMMLVISNF